MVLRVYYRGWDAIVTSEQFVWIRFGVRTVFPLGELADIAKEVDRRGWLRQRIYRLSARQGHRRVTLFESRDLRTFNQVARALSRAVD